MCAAILPFFLLSLLPPPSYLSFPKSVTGVLQKQSSADTSHACREAHKDKHTCIHIHTHTHTHTIFHTLVFSLCHRQNLKWLLESENISVSLWKQGCQRTEGDSVRGEGDLRLEQAGNSVWNDRNTRPVRSQRFITRDGLIKVYWRRPSARRQICR